MVVRGAASGVDPALFFNNRGAILDILQVPRIGRRESLVDMLW